MCACAAAAGWRDGVSVLLVLLVVRVLGQALGQVRGQVRGQGQESTVNAAPTLLSVLAF